MKYALVTFGCRVNQADSLALEADLRQRGGEPAVPEAADLVLVNTCSVTASADQGARQVIRRLARSNPAARIVVTGCYATRRPDEVRILPNVLHVVPNSDKAQLVGAVLGSGTLTTHERFGDGEGPCGAPLLPGTAGRTAFTLRVQTGCAEACTYCIIPETRGVPASLAPSSVVAQVGRAVAAGYREIVLTGVHLGSYGRDLEPRCSLAGLLHALAADRAAHGPETLFRVSSLEPMDCTADVLDVMTRTRGFASHFHLPLQHASDRLLAAMRRPYTLGDYSRLVLDVRRRFPQAAIGTDLIVGFPGESEADFETLAAWLEHSPITHAHVFPYSDRPGTPAASLPGRVPGDTVRARGRILREISARLAQTFRRSQLGTRHRALTIDDGSLAVTGNYLKLKLPAGRPRNEWVDVTVDEVDGELVGIPTAPQPAAAQPIGSAPRR